MRARLAESRPPVVPVIAMLLLVAACARTIPKSEPGPSCADADACSATDGRNGNTIVLEVNGRGPCVDGRFLDVSRRAARGSGFIGAGVAPVRAETAADY